MTVMWEYAPYESPRRSSTWRPPSGVGLDHAKEDDIPFMLAFFDQVLGELQPHHQFADLRTGQGQLTLLGITPRLQPPRPLLEEDALPALELMGRHLALARDRVERLAAQEPQDQLRLPLHAPALRELRHLRRRRFTARSRDRLPRLVLHARPPWLPSS